MDQMEAEHEFFMEQALNLAKQGGRSVFPNPLVGAVIVAAGEIVGSGFHQKYGGPHAEVNAISPVSTPELLSRSTLYVNLEPCSHYGKTPPCADLVIQSGIKRVVVAALDPNPKVNGQGFEKLRAAGIDVITGVLEKEARELNKRFYCLHEKNRPYVILKWAETADGFMAREDFTSKWISSEESRKLVQQWRAEEAAVLVGYRTALHDDPRLTVRDTSGPQPLRVVLGPENKIPITHHLRDGSTATKFLPSAEPLSTILGQLKDQGIVSVLVEGGSKTLQSFLEAGLWDEARVFTSSAKFESGIQAPKLAGNSVETKISGSDTLRFYKNAP